MNQPVLSYIVTTKNKLPYLTHTLARLLAARKPDEEILVADAGSTDGSAEYLSQLFAERKIDYFISEPDFGEPHAINKLLLQARGEVVSIVTDDDAFYYPGKEACREFMLAHPEVDLLASNGGFKNKYLDVPPRPLTYTRNFQQWAQKKTPYNFCGLGIMIRKKSLPILGLWDPTFKAADSEYSFRVTAGKANIAWYTAPTFVNISTPQSVSLVYLKKIKNENARLQKFYLNKNPDLYPIEKIKVLYHKLRSGWPFTVQKESAQGGDWQSLYSIAESWLEKQNTGAKHEFLHNT